MNRNNKTNVDNNCEGDHKHKPGVGYSMGWLTHPNPIMKPSSRTKFRSQVEEGGEGPRERKESRIHRKGTDFISACSVKTSLRAIPEASAFLVDCDSVLKCVLIKARP